MAESSDPPPLLIVTGPVGAGKSAVAQALAGLLRQRSFKVAVIDLDVVYGMIRQREGSSELELWAPARRASGALAATLLDQGFHCVVLDGEYYTPEHFAQVSGALDLPAPIVFALNVAYTEVLRRVQLDASRGESRNPSKLRKFHDAFLNALPFLQTHATLLDAERAPMAQLAAQALAHLDERR